MKKNITIDKCKICNHEIIEMWDPQIKVHFALCKSCGFIHKIDQYHLQQEAEHEQYKLHNNSFENEGYVKIFRDLIEFFITPLNITGNVLDYGSGPGPVLKELLSYEGYKVYDYDPFFQPRLDYLNYQYQLITSTEVVEHFNNPLQEFQKLTSLLEPGGFLVIMTKFRNHTVDEFLKWWYRRDVTHVSFYNEKVFIRIAKLCKLDIYSTNHENIIIFQKK